MIKIITVVLLFIGTGLSCNSLYKAGDLESLSYPVETNLRTSIITAYCDTLIDKYGYAVPNKWRMKAKLVELDSVNNKQLYFKAKPEEMYLISFGGMLVLQDVFNPNIRGNGDYVARRELISNDEEIRIKKRFKTEILDKIEAMAKEKVPDSLLYKY